MRGSSEGSQVSPIISVACTSPGQSPLWCPINQIAICQKSLVSHKPTICDLTAVAPGFYFLWSLSTYFAWLSIGNDCRDWNLCKTTDIVRITDEINCYTEHWHLPLVLAASIRYAKILFQFHETHILWQFAVKVTSEIVSNLVNPGGTYSSMYRLVMTSTAVCTRVCAD
jgi:hypothetical protein